MVWGAIAGAVVGGIMQSSAQKKQGRAATEAARIEGEAADRAFTLQQPYAQSGTAAMTKIEQLLNISSLKGPKETDVFNEIERLRASEDNRKKRDIGPNDLVVVGEGEALPTLAKGQTAAIVDSKGKPLHYLTDTGNGSIQRVNKFSGDGSKFNELTRRLETQNFISPGEQVDFRQLAIENLMAAQQGQGGNGAPAFPGGGFGGSEVNPAAELEATPGYKFTLDQSEKAIKRAASASGYRGSGKLYTELMQNAAGVASTRFDTHMQQLFNVAGIGQAAAVGQAAAINTGAQATSAGIIGKAGAQASMYNTLAQAATKIGSEWDSGKTNNSAPATRQA